MIASLGATVLVLALKAGDSSPDRATRPATASPSAATTGATTVVELPPSRISTSADPGDPRALVREAIANVRVLERLRFEMDVRGPAASSNKATGEIDLATGPDDPVKVHTILLLESPDGSTVTLERINIGDETFARLPGQERFQVVPSPSPQIGPTTPGEATTSGGSSDPVTALLDSLAKLRRGALSTPSPPDANGIRTVRVVTDSDVEGTHAVFVLGIDDEQHLLRQIRFTSGDTTSVIDLSDFGDPSIVIRAPRV